MAEGGDTGPSASALLFGFFGIALLAILVWFVLGGPSRADISNWFVFAPSEIFGTSTPHTTEFSWIPLRGTYTGRTGGSDASQNPRVTQLNQYPSSFKGLVGFSDISGAAQTNPAAEYLELSVHGGSPAPINITGWRIVSVNSGHTAVIGTAVLMPILGLPDTPGAVLADAYGEILVVTGRSPIGPSFRENICSGYLEQYQSFVPTIEQSCPYISSDLTAFGAELRHEDACVKYARLVDQCTTVTNPPPLMSDGCIAFMQRETTYNACVEHHQYDRDFAVDRWRLYEGSSVELWGEHDTLVLLDNQGRLVSAVSY